MNEHPINLKSIILATASSIILLLAVSSCTPNKPEEIKAVTSSEGLPGLSIKDLTTVITDSGKIKYRFVTPELLQFENKTDPTIEFPSGLHLFILDRKEQVEAQIKCKKAIYFKKKELWELKQDVEAVNMKEEVINTELLYWDQKKHTIYSDQYIKITRQSEIITGYGFESDEKLENYKIKNISGILEIEDQVEPEQEE